METIHRIAWALRKVRLPVSADALVLDVGAGSCPYPRSDVLLERYTTSFHRQGTGVVSDRPTVFADGLKMPFKDKAFDFVIASHVLEHVPSPEVFLNELMRVAKAGYIETPNIFLERISPYSAHVLELFDTGGKLHIHKKPHEGAEDFFARLKVVPRHAKWTSLFYGRPQLFHVRYFWSDKIEYEIDNPDENCDWIHRRNENDDGDDQLLETYQGGGWRGFGLRMLGRYYAKRRKPILDWLSILACPKCHGPLVEPRSMYVCRSCNLQYGAKPHPDFLSPAPYLSPNH